MLTFHKLNLKKRKSASSPSKFPCSRRSSTCASTCPSSRQTCSLAWTAPSRISRASWRSRISWSSPRIRRKTPSRFQSFPRPCPFFPGGAPPPPGPRAPAPGARGDPGFFNLIFAARNPVVHDAAVAKVFCLRIPPYIELAGKLGQGEYDIKKIEFVGNEYEALRRDVKQPIGSALLKEGL